MGVNKTSNVNISNLPSIIAKANIPFPNGVTLSYVWETSPRPGPKLFKQAPIAEKADSKSKPVTSKAKSRITKEITYIEKNPQTEEATSSSTVLDPIFKEKTPFG